MLITVARKLIGIIILAADRVTSPNKPAHSPQQQTLLDEKTGNFTLYEMRACPFCVKVRREIKRLGLNIERRDVKHSAAYMNDLIQHGGKFQVPCLRVDNENTVKWMYESDEIIDFLRSI